MSVKCLRTRFKKANSSSGCSNGSPPDIVNLVQFVLTASFIIIAATTSTGTSFEGSAKCSSSEIQPKHF